MLTKVTRVAAFTLGAGVAGVQEEHEDKDDPLAGNLTSNKDKLAPLSARGHEEKQQNNLPLIQFVPLLIKT